MDRLRCPKCDQGPVPGLEESCLLCGYRIPDPIGQEIADADKRRGRRKKPMHAGVHL